MKISFYFYLFLFLFIFLGILFFPTNTELIYVFEKSKNYKMLEKYYRKELNKNFNKKIALKYLNVLKKINPKQYFKVAKKFYIKFKDRKIIDDAIRFSLAKKKYNDYVFWLEKGFRKTGDILYLLKLLDYYSYIHDKKDMISLMKKLYKITKNEKWLDELYGIGEVKFVIDQYLTKKELSLKELRRILNYYLTIKDYKSYVKYLDYGYKKTHDIKYLIQEKNLYSFLGEKKKLISIIKKLYFLTKNNKYLNILYALGEKNFVLKTLERNFSKLNLKEKRQLLKYYTWENNIDKITWLLEYLIKTGCYSDKDIKRLVNIYSYYGKYEKLIKLYKLLYDKTHKIQYLKNLAEVYNYYGFPYKACKVYDKIFKIKKNKKILDEIISIFLALNDTDNFLKYSLLKLKYFYKKKYLKEIVSVLIGFRKINEAIKLTEKFYKKDPSLIHYLITLYLVANENKKALDLLLSISPSKLTNDELDFIATFPELNDKMIAYIERYYKITKNDYFLSKILRYYAVNMRFYMYNKVFKKLLGKINENNVYIYLDNIPDKFKNFKIKEAFRLALSTFNLKLLNKLGVFLENYNKLTKAKKIFEKVLYLDDNNLIALKNLGKIYYWQGEYLKALRFFTKYDRLNSNDPVVKYYIGDIFWNLKEYKKAKKYFRFVVKNINKNSIFNHVLYLKAYIHLFGINDKIIKEYRMVLRKSGFDRDIYGDFIDSLINARKFGILKKEYKKFQSMSTKYTNYLRLIRLFALYNIEIKNYKEAIKLLLKGKKLAISKKEKANVYADLGYLFLQKGDKVKALTYYSKSLTFNSNNKDVLNVVKQLKDELSKNIKITFIDRNKVKSYGCNINYPYKNKLWIGLGYKMYDANDLTEIFFKIEDINKRLFNLEIGKRHFNLELGKDVKIFFKDEIFSDYLTSVKEKMMEKQFGFNINKNNFYLNVSKNFYRNKKGKIAEDTSGEISYSYSLNSSSYITGDFSYVKLNLYKERKTDVYFDDYRAFSVYYTKNFSNFAIGGGGIYDLISHKLNYSISLNFNIKNFISGEYDIYYDSFTKKQINSFSIIMRLRF